MTSRVPSAVTSMNFTAWSIAPDEASDRLQIDFTLLLTAVAFKLLVSDMLPNLDYLTMLDYYVFGCILLLCIMALAHSAMPFADWSSYDATTFYLLAAAWLAFNAAFVAVVFMLNARRNLEGHADNDAGMDDEESNEEFKL